MERVVGVEPTFSAWKAVVLPLDDTRVNGANDRQRSGNLCLGKAMLCQLSYVRILVGAGRLELPKPEGGWFTANCNCRYAILPYVVDASGIEPLLSACKADVLPLSLSARILVDTARVELATS